MDFRLASASRTLALAAALVLAGGTLLSPQPLFAADAGLGRHVVKSDKVKVTNVIGSITVVPADGSDFVVEVEGGGPDASKLRVAVDDCKGGKHLRVVYPSNLVVDRKMGRGSSHETWFDDCAHQRRIKFVRPGEGTEAYANITIRVPRERQLDVEIASGPVEVSKTNASLGIDTGRGDIVARDIIGSASIDTGSGSVRIEGAKGTVHVDAGSGEVDVRDVDGALSIETGSGEVTLARVRADDVSVESGSGGISATKVIAGRFRAECGSGGIEVSGLNSPDASLESGSGGVELDLERSPESLRIETGSGGVRLTAPASLDARLDINCEKARLDIDFPIQIDSQDDGNLRARVGSGKGAIEIGSGSGHVVLRARPS